ncbi:autotransporter domain-containing protein [Aestuariicella hydrocarbonica]|uniref:Autotransporter domain-containing protein n=1 Tax=Pseudomaricurvus hydrocarbonicus TaxID=1470433 RepID=A0A9E5MQD6_9GAMM|nr:autotransporter outer membrane beta-barrel domain-containing protein [Aestuariicella hydrocarbonica]NHO68495.1 autotransporter domain-containing protein [Aestuariicella hydrocarbonica]
MKIPFQKNLLAMSVLMVSMGSQAADFTLSSAETDIVELDSPYETVTVTAAGSVNCAGCEDSALILVGEGFGSLSNAGSLTGGSGGDGLSLALGAMSGDVVNTGTISTIAPDDSLTPDGNSAVRVVYLNEPGAVGGFTLGGNIINDTSGQMFSNGDGYTVEVQEGSSAGGLINRGLIRNDDGSSVGIAGSLTGGIDNSGTIEADSAGIVVQGDLAGGISNSGTIATNESNIEVQGELSGGITNRGTLEVTAGEAWTDAIAVDGLLTGGILNDTAGEIIRNADACTDDPYCLGGGIAVYAGGEVAGGITNKGTIDTTVNGLGNARDAGIILMSVQDSEGVLLGAPTVTGDVSNSGTITSDFAAIYIGGSTVNGDLVNSGMLTAGHGILLSSHAAEVGAGADIEGVHLRMVEAAESVKATVLDGSIRNDGDIFAYDSDGLTLDGDVTITGDIINTGTIISYATTNSDSAFGAIWLGDDSKGGVTVEGSIINSGLLRATPYSSDPDLNRGVITINGSHSVAGIINQAGGEIDNLVFESHSDAYAIWVDDSASLGFITNAGTIYGDIDFGANGGVFNALGGTNFAVRNASRINIKSTGAVGATVSKFYDEADFVYDGVLGVDAFGSASGLAYGQLEVGRGADLRGASVDINVSGDDFIADGDRFTFLTAATGGVGTLQSDITSASDNSVVLNFSVEQVDNTLVAVVARSKITEVLESVSTTGGSAGTNNQEVAGSLDVVVTAMSEGAVAEDSELGQVINDISALGSAEAVAAAVESLQPEAVSGNVAGASAAGNAAAGAVNTRQASLRGYQSEYGESGMVAGGEVTVNGFWLQGYGSNADQDEQSGIDGYAVDTAGLALGFDLPLSDKLTAGLAFTYGQTDVESDDKNTIDIDSYQLSAYGSYNASGYFVDTMLSYAQNTYDSRRTLFNGLVARGDHDGQQYDLRTRLGYPLAINEALHITPQLSAQYTYLDEDRYSEKGAGNAGLTIAPDDNEAFILGASMEAAYRFTSAGQNLWVPSLTLGVYEDLIGDAAEFNSSFVGLPGSGFTTRGADVETTSYVAGLGLRVYGQGNLDVSFNYDYIARSGYESQNLQATVRLGF